MTRGPIPRRRKKPRRVLGREKLYGKAKEARRREIFERSGGYCEAAIPPPAQVFIGVIYPGIRCYRPITWETFHWSHKKHGARKCDCMDCGIASCEECHRNQHNAGGKPCPRKEVV